MSSLKPKILEDIARKIAATSTASCTFTTDSTNPFQYGFRGAMTTILRNGNPIRHMPHDEDAKAVVARVRELIDAKGSRRYEC